jgi:hypothetical protein
MKRCRLREIVQFCLLVDIRPEWSVLEQLQVTQLGMLGLKALHSPSEHLEKYGKLSFYCHIIVCVPAKTPFSLTKAQSVLRSVIASEEAVLKQISEDGKARVLITDAVLHYIDVHM